MRDHTELEICCGDLNSVLAAAEGGARRIELCSALGEGGVTPSIGLISMAVASGIPDINVLIRPRPGDFCYSEAEVELMALDARNAVKAGATGIVIGALTPQGDIDVPTCRRIIDAAGSCNVTFHRAFDLCRDAATALETVIELGCRSLLTSGQAASAFEGMEMLGDLVKRAGGRISIMAGAGVNPENCRSIIKTTKVPAVHTSARETAPGPMEFIRTGLNMGAPGVDEYTRKTTGADIVRLLRTLCCDNAQ